MRTICVTGKGLLKLSPDTTRIGINLQGLEQDYNEALRRSSEETGFLQQLLTAFGFQPKDLKTLDFSVDTEYESEQENGVYRQRFAGYRFRHAMKLDFPSDDELLGRLLYALANCDLHPELSLSYTVSDPEKAKNALLSLAVRDAREKALVLSTAAGFTGLPPGSNMFFLQGFLVGIKSGNFHVFRGAFSITAVWADIEIIVAHNHKGVIDGRFHLETIAVLHDKAYFCMTCRCASPI